MRILHDNEYYNKTYVFRDRIDAGIKLAHFVSKFDTKSKDVVAIPAGGVPVAYSMAKKLNSQLRVLLVSKILFPWTTEAGFGALSMFGDIELNKDAIKYYGINEDTIREQVRKTQYKIEKRLKIIPKNCLIAEKGDEVFLVDDGLASGYTMLVAIKSAKRFYDKIYVAVPTASYHAANLISKECDALFCINLRSTRIYAVADAYLEWHDVDDEEMLKFLEYCK